MNEPVGVRVMHVISELGTGGAERLVVELVEGSPRHGWTPGVVSGGGRWAVELERRGVETYAIPVVGRSPVRFVRAVLAVRRAVRRFRPDVVLAHNVVATLVARKALGRRRTPLLTVFHGVAPEDYRRAARILTRHADEVVVVAEALGRRLKAAGLGPRPVHVVRNAVTPAPETDRAAARRALGLPSDRPVVVCLARMVRQKRHDVLLRAWAALGPEPLLLLAGGGPLRASLEAQTTALDLTDQVRFLGVRDDVDRLLAAADLSVLSSDWEGLPFVVLESLAARRPVVATDVDGVRDLLTSGGGVLVPPDDAGALATAVRELLADAPTRERLVESGTELLRRDHDPARMLCSYDELLRRPGRPAGAGTVVARTDEASLIAPSGRAERAPRRASPRWRWLVIGALSALVGIVVGGSVVLATALQPPRYEGRIGLLALPAVVDPADPAAQTAGSAGYGEVVALALPSLTELATTPSVLAATRLTVPDAPPADELAGDIGVELLPGSGVARLSVRAETPELASRLVEVLAASVIRADVLAPAATLRVLDDRATVTQVSPDLPLGTGLALLAGLVAAAATAAFLRPFRPRLSAGEAVLDALNSAGRGPVAVLDGADPVLITRIIVLQRAADRPLRVLGTSPGLGRQVRALEAELAENAVFSGVDGLGVNGNGNGDRPGVVVIVDRRRTRADDVTAAVSSLPDAVPLLAVVLV